MEYVATFKEHSRFEGYYILIQAKNIEKATEYMEKDYCNEYSKVYPRMVYLRYRDEYGDKGLYSEIKLKEVKVK